MQDVNNELFTDEVFKELSLGVKNFDEKKSRNYFKRFRIIQFKRKTSNEFIWGIETESSYSINFMQRFYFYIF